MKKFVRFSFILILLVIVATLVLGYILPREAVVSRTIYIRAGKASVQHRVSDFRQWQSWCTLFSSDTAVQFNYDGPDGMAGSSMVWHGQDGRTGSGTVTNEGVDDSSLKYSFHVTSPGEFLATGEITTSDTAYFSKVTWTFRKQFPYPFNAVLVIFDLEKYMAGDMERSLSNLKKVSETSSNWIAEIREASYKGCILAGIRDTVAFSELTTFFGDTYSLFNRADASFIKGPHTGIYYSWDMEKGRADVMAGVPVADTEIPVNGIIFAQLPASKALMAVYHGGYSGLGKAHEQIKKALAKKGATYWLTVEEYPVYPGNETDSSKWVTNVYYLLQ